MDFIYENFVKGQQKALTGLLLGAVGAFLVKHGFSLDMTLGDALQALVAGVVTAMGVYVKKNQ